MSIGFKLVIENATGVIDDVTAVLAPEVVDLVVDAVAAQYGWTATVPNPDYDANFPDTEANPQTIANMTKGRFFSYQVRKWAVQVLAGYQVTLAQKQAAQQVMAQVNALEDSMVFEEPLA